MFSKFTQTMLVQLAAIAVLSAGFVQPATAGTIGTQQLIDSENRHVVFSRMELLLAEENVAEKLISYGVQPQHVLARMENMTNDELMALEGRIDEQVAGSGALGVIGAVFLVLLILELVGITDIFKKI